MRHTAPYGAQVARAIQKPVNAWVDLRAPATPTRVTLRAFVRPMHEVEEGEGADTEVVSEGKDVPF